jgi:2'-5' RNA ligase
VPSVPTAAEPVPELHDHWVWRPEWTPERTCWYWYVTFRDGQLADALGEATLASVRADWLDAVPLEWCHVTFSDVGFTDELGPGDAARVTEAVSEALAGQPPLRLTLGPVQALRSAVALGVQPAERLRSLRAAVRQATSRALRGRHADVHRHPFRPHLSLGYVNRPVEPETAREFLEGLPEVGGRVDVDALTLVAVTRRQHCYRWDVEATVLLQQQ